MPLVAPDEQRRAIRQNSLRVMPMGFGLTKISIPECEYPVLTAQPLKTLTPLPSARPLAPTVAPSSQCSFDSEDDDFTTNDPLFQESSEEEEEEVSEEEEEEYDARELPPGACAGQTICLPKECSEAVPPSAVVPAAEHKAPPRVIANSSIPLELAHAHAPDTPPHAHSSRPGEEDGNPYLTPAKGHLSRRDSELSRSDTYPRNTPLTGKSSASEALSSPGSDNRPSPSVPPRRTNSGRKPPSLVQVNTDGHLGAPSEDLQIEPRKNAVVSMREEGAGWACLQPSPCAQFTPPAPELTAGDIHLAALPSNVLSPNSRASLQPAPQRAQAGAPARCAAGSISVDLKAAAKGEAAAPKRKESHAFQIAPNSPIPRMSLCFPPLRQFMGLQGKQRSAELLGHVLHQHAKSAARPLPSPSNAAPNNGGANNGSNPARAAPPAHRAAGPVTCAARKLSDPPAVQEVSSTAIPAGKGSYKQRAAQRALSIATGGVAPAPTDGVYMSKPPSSLIPPSPSASPVAMQMFAMGMPLSPSQMHSVQARVAGGTGRTPQGRTMVHEDLGVSLTANTVYSSSAQDQRPAAPAKGASHGDLAASYKAQEPSVPPRAVKLMHTHSC